jgi:hypothetical protein
VEERDRKAGSFGGTVERLLLPKTWDLLLERRGP